MFKNFRLGIYRAAAADDDAQIVFAEAAGQPLSLVFFPPGPRVTPGVATVRAPAITASAVARSSIMCSRSRSLPKGTNSRLAKAIFPSAVIAKLEKTNGSFWFLFFDFSVTKSAWHRHN